MLNVEISKSVPIAVYDSVSSSFPRQMSSAYTLRIEQQGYESIFHRAELLSVLKSASVSREASVYKWILKGGRFCPAEQ